MADQSIAQLDPLTSAALAAGDLLPVVDTSAGQTKKITTLDLVQKGIALTASGNIDLAKLNQNSTTKIGSVAIASGAVTAEKLAADSSIATATAEPSGSNFTGRGWFDSSTGNLQVYSAGAYQQVVLPSGGILDGAIVASKIPDGTITTAKIAASGLGAAAIASGAITSTKVASGAITASAIAAATIQTSNIALDAIDSTLIASGAVGTSQLATSGITTDKLAAGAVDETALGTGAVTNDKIASGTIAYDKLNLADGSIPGSKITNATISGLQLATGGIPTAALEDGAVTNDKIAASGIEAGKLAAGAVTEAAVADGAISQSKLATGVISADQLAASGVTAEKLADNSSVIVAAGAPEDDGAFVGQQWFDDSSKVEYTWDGTAWERQAAINAISFTDSSPIAFSVAYPDNFSAEITSALDTQAANTVFAGPTTGADTEPTFRTLTPADLPVATDATVGAVQPGAGLEVAGDGTLNHSNVAVAGTYTGSVTIDAEGHITSALAALQASDIPSLDASKITTGTFAPSLIADSSISAQQLADFGIAKIGVVRPATADFSGQWWVNPTDRAAAVWVGEVGAGNNGYWLNVGYGSPEQLNLRFGGTYNASGNVIEAVSSPYGTEAGLVVGSGLSTPSTTNNGVYLIVTANGSGVTPAPLESLEAGNWIVSLGAGTNWTSVDLGIVGETVTDNDVLVNGNDFTPVVSGVANQEELNQELWSRVQVATSGTAGIVRGSSTIQVASGTGIMSVVEIDEGEY